MAREFYYMGVDVGGQSIKGGVVDDDGQALSNVSVPTECAKGQEHGLEQICLTVREAAMAAKLEMADISAIGVATPGTMDIPAGIILDPFNLRPWQNVPVKQYVHDKFGLPTAFQNDANAAAFGEYWAGAGKGCHSMVLFTLGTGIGCGIIVAEMVIEGEHSHGAEVGHSIVEARNGRICGCGQPGHLEAYASAIAVAKRTNEALDAQDGPSKLRDLRESAGEIQPEHVREIFDGAAQGDGIAESIVDETAFYLAIGAVNMMHTINPNMVVFGGGMTAAGESFIARIRKYINQYAFPVPAERTEVVYAQLGNDAGFIGAAACARQLVVRSNPL